MSKKINEQEYREAQEIHTSWKLGQTFKSSINLPNEIKRSIKFVEGDQWRVVVENDDYPKITLNFIKQIMFTRQAGIHQNDYSFLVNTLRFKDAKKIQYFLKYLYNKMKIRKKNLQVIEDNFKKGTSGLYFYWDADSRSPLNDTVGELKAEVIDIRNMVVADPELTDIQEQEWIIFHIREKIEALQYKYPNKKIVADGILETRATQKEQTGRDEKEEFVSVYIKFYRNKEGQVCYTMATPTCVLEKEKALNPFYEGETKEVPNTLSTPDEKDETKESSYKDVVFGLYPFAIYTMDKRDNCFYGIPGAYEYLEAQKSVNAHFSTYDYALSQMVMGGWVVEEGILKDQEITTDRGQVIQVKLPPNKSLREVLMPMPTTPLPADSLNYGSALINMMKVVSGASNVQMGQADYANQTAKATEMLIARARENTSQYAILFEEYMKEIAMVMFMFAKFYYRRKEFNIIEHGTAEDYNHEYKDDNAFVGEDFIMEEVDFDIRVSPSSQLNEATLQQIAMLSVQTGNLKLLDVLKMLPYNTFPSFKEIENGVMKNDDTLRQFQMLQERMKQQEQVIQQMADAYNKSQEQLKNVDIVIRENMQLKENMASVYAKSVEASKEANEKTKEVLKDMQGILESYAGGKENEEN